MTRTGGINLKKLFGIVCVAFCLIVAGCSGGGGSGDNKIKIACVTGAGYYNSEYYTESLNPYGFEVINIDKSNVAVTDFGQYKLIIIGAYGGYLSEAAINKIYQSGKCVIGVGSWGSEYFQKIPIFTSKYPHLSSTTSTPVSTNSIAAKNKNDIIWTHPNKIDTNNGIVKIRNSYELAYAINKDAWTNENNISFGYISIPGGTSSTTYDTLCLENKHYFLWGYSEPNNLSDEGKKLFVNVVDYMTKL
jgi:hypothetical protein